MSQHSAFAVAPACLRLLGGWQLIVDGVEVELGHREQRLVALLGLTDLTGRGQVASVLWPESTDEHALGSLRRAVRQCRTKSPGVLVADRLTVALDPCVRVDVDDLRRTAGLTRLPMTDAVARELLDSLRGPELLPGWFDDRVVEERAALEHLRVEALERIAHHGLRQGDHALAVDASGIASAIEPLRESARELAIRGHLGRGDVVHAARELQRYAVVLEDELGVEPSERIRALLEPTAAPPVARRRRRESRCRGSAPPRSRSRSRCHHPPWASTSGSSRGVATAYAGCWSRSVVLPASPQPWRSRWRRPDPTRGSPRRRTRVTGPRW